jgi:hypothetical protein
MQRCSDAEISERNAPSCQCRGALCMGKISYNTDQALHPGLQGRRAAAVVWWSVPLEWALGLVIGSAQAGLSDGIRATR